MSLFLTQTCMNRINSKKFALIKEFTCFFITTKYCPAAYEMAKQNHQLSFRFHQVGQTRRTDDLSKHFSFVPPKLDESKQEGRINTWRALILANSLWTKWKSFPTRFHLFKKCQEVAAYVAACMTVWLKAQALERKAWHIRPGDGSGDKDKEVGGGLDWKCIGTILSITLCLKQNESIITGVLSHLKILANGSIHKLLPFSKRGRGAQREHTF